MPSRSSLRSGGVAGVFRERREAQANMCSFKDSLEASCDVQVEDEAGKGTNAMIVPQS